MKTIANTNLDPNVFQPSYDRERLRPRIVHIGFGAFHRAHQALYTNELAEKTDSDWGYCEVTLFGGETLISSLRNQDHQYTVLEKAADGKQAKLIKSIKESLHVAFDGIEAIIEKLAAPETEIVSMTITEKGYCVDAATGELDTDNQLIKHDLENSQAPKSAIGYIVESLKRRKERQLPSFTVMSCDNIQGNGKVARNAVLRYAKLVDGDLADWIETHTTFPCTMVDRIVPAATEETLKDIEDEIGVYDPCGIACEAFRQWVIEDHFVSGRPDWDQVGAQFVDDVIPYEEMKLRMLNGSHSFLAYLGYLAGYEHISNTMEDPNYRNVALAMMLQVQAPSLVMPEGTNLTAYAHKLIERFTNPNLKHRTWQIAMDGSQKIPQRLVGSLRYHLQQANDIRILATGIAGWIRYSTGIDEQGNAIEVLDPMITTLKTLYEKEGTKPDVVKKVLSLTSIFPEDIGQNNRVIEAVTNAYQSLLTHGAKDTVAKLEEAL